MPFDWIVQKLVVVIFLYYFEGAIYLMNITTNSKIFEHNVRVSEGQRPVEDSPRAVQERQRGGAGGTMGGHGHNKRYWYGAWSLTIARRQATAANLDVMVQKAWLRRVILFQPTMQQCLIPLTYCPNPPPPPHACCLSPEELGTINNPDSHTSTTDKRYQTLMHMLSFMSVRYNRFPDNLLRKYHEVNDSILAQCQAGRNIESEAVMDEWRLKTHSKTFPFTWTMFCKPIHNGCTNYLLILKSGYLYSWRWWLGKSTKTRSQPTENKELDEDTSLEVGAVQHIFDFVFVDKEFKDTNIVVYVDKTFSSIRLCNWAEGLDVLIVAMTKGGRPKVMKLPAINYWPFRRTTNLDEALQEKMWLHTAYTQLPSRR